METTEIVVGADGSASSVAAVRWAAREAKRRGLPLRIVHAFHRGWASVRPHGGTEPYENAGSRADTVLADAAVQATRAAPGVDIHRDLARAQPGVALLNAADRAALVIVGNRGHGDLASLLLGSVSQYVAGHAPCPVAVVRGRHDADDGPVIVGVDGSPSAQNALGLAFQLAAERGSDLVAIRAYTPPTPPTDEDAPALFYDRRQLAAVERRALEYHLSAWREKYPMVSVDARVVRGPAARVLVEVSRTAQLVVIGNRGHGRIAGTLLGSVSLRLTHHADCPVLIDRPKQRETAVGQVGSPG